jgi:hypothetical protein
MGYTHYWNKIKELPQDKWDNFTKDVSIILLHETEAQELLCSEWGQSREVDTAPVIDKDLVRFNGKGEDGHETFYFSRVAMNHEHWRLPSAADGKHGKYFSFCKTAKKPYDKYVVRVLLLAEKHFGKDIEIESDGDWETVAKEQLYQAVQEVE